MDYFHWERKKTAIIVLVYCLLMGIPSSLGFGVWDFIQPLGMSNLQRMGFHQQQHSDADRCAADLFLCRICHQAKDDHRRGERRGRQIQKCDSVSPS